MAPDKYSDIVESSYASVQKFAEYKIDEKTTIRDRLYLRNHMISLLSIFEVILAIHIFPNVERNRWFFWKRRVAYVFRRHLKKVRRRDIGSQHTFRFPAGKKIYFLGFSQYLADENFDLIIKQLIADGDYFPVIITDEDWQYDSEQLSVLNISAFNEISIFEKAFQLRSDIKEIFGSLRSQKKDLKQQSKEFLRGLEFISERSIHEIPFLLASADYVLRSHPPAAIVSVDVADPRARVVTLLANSLDIPVVQLQAGPIDAQCVEWRCCKDDLVLTHGPLGKLAVHGHGVPEEKIFAVGSAKHERLLAIRNSELLDFHSIYQLEKKTKVIVLLSTYLGLFSTSRALEVQKDIFSEMYEALLRSVNTRTGVTLVIKPHVLEGNKRQLSDLERGCNVRFMSFDDNTQLAVASADAVLSFGSTATIDAFILGKRTRFLGFNGWMGTEHLEANLGHQFILKSVNEIDEFLDSVGVGQTLRTAVSERACEDFVNQISTNGGAGSVERIVGKLYNIASK